MLVRFLYTANTTYLKNEIMLYVRAMLYFLAIWTFYLDLGKLFQKSSMIWPLKEWSKWTLRICFDSSNKLCSIKKEITLVVFTTISGHF